MAKSDNVSLKVTALMSLPGFPTGPVDQERIQREAQVMLQFGVLGTEYSTQVGREPWSRRWWAPPADAARPQGSA